MLGVETAPTAVAPDPLMNSDLFKADDDDSDEEIFRSVKPKQKRSSNTHRLILSDEEDDESLPTLSDQGKPQSDVERESSVDFSKKDDAIEDENKDNIIDSSDSDNENAKERKKIRRPVASSDDSDEESHPGNDSINVDRSEKKIRRPVASSDDSDEESHPDNEDIDVDQSERKKIMHRPILSSDDSDGDSTSDEEEEEEEGEIAFQLTPPAEDPETETNGDKRSMRRKRISKDELQQIHSESQRIVRESTIRIPYHHPKPLSLDELFNKKPTLTATKLIGNRVPRINGKQLNTKEEMNSKKESKEENDELPDVLSSQAQETTVNDTSYVENSESSSKEISSKEISSEDKTDEIKLDKDTVVPESETINELQKDEAKSAESETNNSVEADVESISVPTSSSSKPNELSPPKTSEDVSKEDQLSSKLSEQTSKEDQIPMFKTPPPAITPRHDPQSSQARRMKLLQDSLNRLKGVQPKLSGGPKITIDLDDDVEPSAEEKGVAKLMKRFVKHTKPVHKIHQKDVQISIVTKEKGVDGKEDLKHHTLTVGLDSKPDKIDPRLNIPGAKLCRLKENLQATMRVKREQERLKRQEVFKLDNEEGFEDEDEAELTEGSDTEDEEGERDHGNVDEDADEDADYEPGNEFLDDEAESDDDDDKVDDEMDDEDEEEKSTVVKKLKKKSRSIEKESRLIDSDDEISPSRRKGNKKRAMVVDDVDEGGGEEKGITLRLDSTGTDDTDTEISDALQDSGRFNSIRTPRSISALDQCSKTMEMFDSATNSTVNSDFQVPISRVDTNSKKVSWNASKDSDSSKDGMSFVLPAPVRQDSSSNSLDTSFDTISLIPAHQPDGGTRRSGRTSIDSTKSDTFTPFSKHQSVLSNISSKTTSRNELTLPVEDSQDLCCEDSPRLPTITDSQQALESQSFHFSFEDETQTQFLDENGLLNLKPSSSSNKKKTIFENTQAPNTESQSSMEELLGLCSGQFTATQGQDEGKSQKPGPFSQVSQRSGTQANMDELLNLCSGTFTEIDPKSEITSTRKIDENDDKDDDNGFEIASDPDGPDSDDDNEIKHGLSSDEEDIAPKKRRRIIQQESDDDDEEEEDDGKERKEDDSDLDSEFDLEINREGFKGKTYGKKLDIAKFVEEEAELSGSEFDSDENYDAEDEPDDEDIEGIVNEEMGDEDELRNQVNKVHLKTMDDDDARRLRIFKEMYLPDGDLHSDNKGRTRKFRWRHVDSQMDMFRPGSDGEEDEEEANDQDTQWRLLRHDREQWLKENEGKAGPATPSIDEDSQFAKCLKAATIKKPQETKTQDVGEKEKEKDKKVGTPKPLKIMSTRGSFLSRSKNDLAKMASMLKPIANPQGPRNSRGFVFQSAEASLGEDSQTEPPPKVKRSASVSGPSTTPSGPQPKKPRLERSQSHFTSNSVFRHF